MTAKSASDRDKPCSRSSAEADVTICILDTSVLVELLGVPGYDAQHEARVEEYARKLGATEQFLLPVAVLLETGNHIAKLADGRLRRAAATTFGTFAKLALEGNSPFVPAPAPDAASVEKWLATFPESAERGVSLVDASLISLWEDQCALHASRRVYIWSLDGHLSAHDRRP